MAFTYNLYTCKGTKNEKLKLYTNKLPSNQTNNCSKAIRQRTHFRTKNKRKLTYRQLSEMSNHSHKKQIVRKHGPS